MTITLYLHDLHALHDMHGIYIIYSTLCAISKFTNLPESVLQKNYSAELLELSKEYPNFLMLPGICFFY